MEGLPFPAESFTGPLEKPLRSKSTSSNIQISGGPKNQTLFADSRRCWHTTT